MAEKKPVPEGGWPTAPSDEYIISHPASEYEGGYGQDDVRAAENRADADEATEAQLELGQEALDAQLELAQRAQDIADAQEKRAEQQWRIYTNVYLPNEIAFAQASFAGIPVDQELAWASNGVTKAYDDAWETSERDMSRLGVDPSDPLYNSKKGEFDMARAAADAGARNEARRNVRDTNYERQRQSVLTGRGVVSDASGISSQAATTYGTTSNIVGSGYNSAIGTNQFAAGQANFNTNQMTEQQRIAAEQEMAMWGAIGALGGSSMQAAGTAYGSGGTAAACWVARAVFGAENPRWLMFRAWLFNLAPAWFRNLYLRHGERFAAWLSDKPRVKGIIRAWMNSRINNAPPGFMVSGYGEL